MQNKNNTLSANTIDMVKAGIIRNQARIIDLLKWNMAVYSNFLYNSGLRYLEEYMSRDEEAISKMTPRKEFWNWWKLKWNDRDEVFVNEWDGLEDEVEMEDMRKLYREMHDINKLVCEIAPPSAVYPSDFTTVKMAMA